MLYLVYIRSSCSSLYVVFKCHAKWKGGKSLIRLQKCCLKIRISSHQTKCSKFIRGNFVSLFCHYCSLLQFSPSMIQMNFVKKTILLKYCRNRNVWELLRNNFKNYYVINCLWYIVICNMFSNTLQCSTLRIWIIWIGRFVISLEIQPKCIKNVEYS